ncbi:serralysin family metalloprotease [Serratia sp. MF1(2023)]|uniref:serralysin family metalloprotease n=1 Tax=unclassified Serratia (in: enterobacteria) TaxID=2647522 RepID=UPI0035ABC4DE
MSESNAVNEVSQLIRYHERGDGITYNGKPSYTIENAADTITRTGYSWNGKNVTDTAAIVTYSFRDDGVPVTDAQKTIIKSAMESWSDVANITFKEVEDTTEQQKVGFVIVNDPNMKQTGASGSFPISGNNKYLKIGPTIGDLNNTNPPENIKNLYTHELGHILGLSHPGNYDASGGTPLSYDSQAKYAEDNNMFTVMTYWGSGHVGGEFGHNHSPYSPQVDDIAAAQKLYGANMSTRTGDDVYGFHNTTGKAYYTALEGKPAPIFAIWDAGGNDTLDFSGYLQDQRINLNEGSISDVGGLKGNISIAAGVTIENAIGGADNDVIVGNSADNLIKGGGGNDIIYGSGGQDILWGGSGNDTFVFSELNDSPISSPDKVMDFESGKDKIDLSFFNQIEEGHDFIHFVEHFSGHAGEALLSYDSQNNLSELALNLNGNANPDFLVQLVGKVEVTTDVIA